VPDYTSLSDEYLMASYSAGDAGAFDVLYDRHRGGLYRFILRQCGNASVAEELYQDVWTGIIRSHSSYQPTAKFTTWLYTVARNRLTDYYRREQARGMVAMAFMEDEHAANDSTQPEQQVSGQAQVQRLMQMIAGLPDEQREAFLLKHESGLSVDEIADITGVNSETAKSRLRYAVNKLKQVLEE
jgi:RNA polymerase sigma-70 factor (ECF subfamily)